MDPDVTLEAIPESAGPAVAPKPRRTKRPTEPDRGPFFRAMWQGRAVYRCPVCWIAEADRGGVSGDAAIRAHLIKHHATAQPTPEQRVRTSGLVIAKR